MEADPTEGGTAVDETGESPYTEGTVVDILAVPDTGWAFLNWTSDAGGIFADANDPDTTFTMPGDDVTVTAVFYQPHADTGYSSASWTNNGDGTGTMSLIVRDPHDNPMPGFDEDDIAIMHEGTLYTLNDLDDHALWTVDSFVDEGNGNYTVVLNRVTDYDSVWDVLVTLIVIELAMDVVITGNL